MSELLAAVITLTPDRPCTLDEQQGRALHAQFLRLTAAVDPGLADALHEGRWPRPFTSSNLLGLPEGRGGRVSIGPGLPLAWRVTAFDGGLSALWLGRVLPGLPDVLQVADAALRVTGWTIDPREDPNAGLSSFAALAAQHLRTARPPAPRVELAFVSPTAFRSHDVHLPLPVPGLLLGSWRAKWAAFAPSGLADAAALVSPEDEPALSRYELHTEAVRFGPSTTIGFAGRCSLSVRGEGVAARLPHLLAAFSFWCGTGHHTGFGLGQTRVVG